MHTVVKNLLKMNLRCLLLQACWNFRVFQGVGSAWIMQSCRRDGSAGSAENNSDTSSHSASQITYFNTNTFCAPTVFAAQLSLHEKQARGEYVVIGADEFAAAVMAPVAAVGDALFWGGLRPLAALAAIILTLQGFSWAPLVVVLLFTLPCMIVRIAGSILGYVRGAQVVALIQQLHLANLAVRIKQINIVLLGVIAALTWNGLGADLDLGRSSSMHLAALVLLGVGINVFLLRHKIPIVVVLAFSVVLFSSAASIVQP
ncbi:MAG: PTS system mannose/fructose/sorbose family transporter subunit IID [Desulfuromonadaceae bacterium]|nr:PTS system mannose/fructose/sorbose family transporter subunit IID [Geobacteraceae bacterium]